MRTAYRVIILGVRMLLAMAGILVGRALARGKKERPFAAGLPDPDQARLLGEP